MVSISSRPQCVKRICFLSTGPHLLTHIRATQSFVLGHGWEIASTKLLVNTHTTLEMNGHYWRFGMKGKIYSPKTAGCDYFAMPKFGISYVNKGLLCTAVPLFAFDSPHNKRLIYVSITFLFMWAARWCYLKVCMAIFREYPAKRARPAMLTHGR